MVGLLPSFVCAVCSIFLSPFFVFFFLFSAKNLSPSAHGLGPAWTWAGSGETVGQCSRAHCGSHGIEFGPRLVSVASALGVDVGVGAQRTGPTLAELCVALCAAIVGCSVCRLLFGCLVVVATWSTHVLYNCVAVVWFFLELLLAVQATGAGIDTKVSTTVQSSGSGSNYVLFALDCSCSNP